MTLVKNSSVFLLNTCIVDNLLLDNVIPLSDKAFKNSLSYLNKSTLALKIYIRVKNFPDNIV